MQNSSRVHQQPGGNLRRVVSPNDSAELPVRAALSQDDHAGGVQGVFQSLPEHVRAQLENCPAEGDGVHGWLFRTALVLHRCGVDPDDIETLLEQHASRSDGREIAEAVRNSDPKGQAQKRYAANPALSPRWPRRDYRRIVEVIRNGPNVAQLKEKSSVSLFGSHTPNAAQIVEWLFPEDVLLCCASTQWRFATRPRSEWGDNLELLQFVVPSPMLARAGRTQDGKPSAHTKENTGPRRYLVIEFDFKSPDGQARPTPDAALFRVLRELNLTPLDACAALLWELGKALRLDLVVFSGGKSLHGWFYCAGIPDEKLIHFMRYAVQLGADPVTWNRAQFVRMPEGLRKAPPNRQSVCFVGNINR